MAASRRPFAVATVYLGTFMASLAISIVSVALPAIQADLHGGLAGLQWIVGAYALCLSAFMLSTGPLADRYGRKRSWLGGVAGRLAHGTGLSGDAHRLAVVRQAGGTLRNAGGDECRLPAAGAGDAVHGAVYACHALRCRGRVLRIAGRCPGPRRAGDRGCDDGQRTTRAIGCRLGYDERAAAGRHGHRYRATGQYHECCSRVRTGSDLHQGGGGHEAAALAAVAMQRREMPESLAVAAFVLFMAGRRST